MISTKDKLSSYVKINSLPLDRDKYTEWVLDWVRDIECAFKSYNNKGRKGDVALVEFVSEGIFNITPNIGDILWVYNKSMCGVRVDPMNHGEEGLLADTLLLGDIPKSCVVAIDYGSGIVLGGIFNDELTILTVSRKVFIQHLLDNNLRELISGEYSDNYLFRDYRKYLHSYACDCLSANNIFIKSSKNYQSILKLLDIVGEYTIRTIAPTGIIKWLNRNRGIQGLKDNKSFTQYLANALSYGEADELKYLHASLKFDNPEIVRVTPQMILHEINYRGYLN